MLKQIMYSLFLLSLFDAVASGKESGLLQNRIMQEGSLISKENLEVNTTVEIQGNPETTKQKKYQNKIFKTYKNIKEERPDFYVQYIEALGDTPKIMDLNLKNGLAYILRACPKNHDLLNNTIEA